MELVYLVYKTINLTNGKYYIGKHMQEGNQFDGYFGSSPHLQNAIKKYGAESFNRVTLMEFINEKECYSAEKRLVGDLWKTDKNCYNKQPGGKGFSSGLDHYTQGNGFTDAHKENLTKSRNKRPPHSEVTKQRIAESNRGGKRSAATKAKMSKAQSGKNNPMYGKKHTDEKRKEIGDKLRGKYTGEKCSGFKGYYITPWGRFVTLADAITANDIIKKGALRLYCKQQNRIITKNMIGISKYLTAEDLGKTYKEIGFDFENK